MWLTELQIAIVEKNTQSLEKLLEELPKFESVAEMESAMYLLKEASILLHTLKDETSLSMEKMKKSMQFLRSTHSPLSKGLDIIS